MYATAAAARGLLIIAAVISSAAVAAAAAVDPAPTPVASSSLSSTLAATFLQSFASFNPLLLPSDASTGGEPISTPSVPDWHFSAKDQFGIPVLLKQACFVWSDMRKTFVVPALWAAVVACLVMSVMLLIEALSMSAVSLFVKLFRRTPQKRYNWAPIGEDGSLKEKEDSALSSSGARTGDGDLESGTDGICDSSGYPKVLVQIPMYNEKEVYKQSIGAACALTWPANRIVIQVLDDSTDPVVKELVEMECRNWVKRGININYEVRNCRKGYKAGALKEGMKHQYVKDCEFVAIFDSDFQPHSDFLMKTIPFLTSNSDIALIQTRWEFVNYNECLLTRIQKMTLDYHFKVEQEAGSSTFAFFGFNGTAGVWRISAINEAGGWKDRTTVEDMDLAVRATLKGWKFLYVGDIKVKSELPSSFKAYRYQQHRWTCGAANLFRKMVKEIILTKDVSVWKKFYVAYNFFFVRKVICHIVTFMFYCVVIPISVFVPEVHIPTWGVVYIPTSITILTAIRNPSSIHLLAFWIVFENVMSLHRMKATLTGLLNVRGVNEWVVTEKLGEGDTATPDTPLLEKHEIRLRDRIYITEILFGLFLSLCATFDLIYSRDYFYFYIYLQAVAFFIVGFGYVGTFVSRH